MKKLPKILTIVFLSFIIIQTGAFLFLNLFSEPSQAIDFKPQVDIGIPSGEITPTSIGEYIRAIYKYAIGIVGILAAVVLMFGGILWLTAGGNTERIGSAKSWIGAALTGLVLALCSYMILAMINPDLVNFESINPKKVNDYYGGGYEAPPLSPENAIPCSQATPPSCFGKCDPGDECKAVDIGGGITECQCKDVAAQ